MPDPTRIIPVYNSAQPRRTAVAPIRRVRALTQTLGVPELEAGGGVISGVASVAGVPVTGAIISLLTDPGNVIVKQTISGVGGTYAFSALPAGRYQVLVYDPTQMYRSKVIHVDVPEDRLTTEAGDRLTTEDGAYITIEG